MRISDWSSDVCSSDLLTGHFLAKSVIVALHEHVLPVVKDMDPRDLEAIHQKVWKRLNPRAMTGTVSMALSCLDIALWDILGKAEGRPIASLLDTPRQKRAEERRVGKECVRTCRSR